MSDFDDTDPDSPRRLSQSPDAEETEEARREEAFYRYFQDAARVPWLTTGLVFGCAAVFGGMISQGATPLFANPAILLDWGANYGPLTSSGEPWRLLSGIFLHGNIVHLATTLYVLWQLGRFVERLVGHAAFLILFLLSGLCAGIVATLWQPDQISVSASGAVTGVLGLIFSFLILRGDDLPSFIRRSMTRSTVLNLFIIIAVSVAEPVIPLAGHAGGLVAGFALGFLLIGRLSPEGRAGQMARNLKAAAAGTVMLAGVLYTMPPLFDPFLIVDKHLKAKTYDAGLAELAQLPNADPDSPKMIQARIELLDAAGRTEEVLIELDKAIAGTEDSSDLAFYYTTRAQIAYKGGNWNSSVEDFTRALSFMPEYNRAILHHLRAFAYFMLERDKEAEEDWRKAADFTPTLAVDKKLAAEQRAGSLENVGMIYIRNEKWQEAMNWTESVNALHPGMVWNALFRGIAATKMGLEAEAKTALGIWNTKKKPEDIVELKRFLSPEFHEFIESDAATEEPVDAQDNQTLGISASL